MNYYAVYANPFIKLNYHIFLCIYPKFFHYYQNFKNYFKQNINSYKGFDRDVY